MKLYKIRDKKTGLFSLGGMYPYFSKKGKTWKQLNHVKSHLKIYDGNVGTQYKRQNIDYEVVEYSYVIESEKVLTL